MPYGVHLNTHPSGTMKRVIIHAPGCSYYKVWTFKGLSKDAYTFNKNCATLRAAVDRASLWALEWHAPISLCRHCFQAGQKNVTV